MERCLLPPPLSWEPSGVSAQYDELIQSTGLITVAEELDQSQEINDLSSSEASSEDENEPSPSDRRSGDSSEDEDENDDDDDDDIANPPSSNALVHRCSSTCSGSTCPPDCYDPSFYLPMLQHVLVGRFVTAYSVDQSSI